MLIVGFNPRTHSGCDESYQGCYVRLGSFNPRTHSGCDDNGSYPEDGYRVSIHAPTRGATHNVFLVSYSRKFQSTHPLGVRHARKDNIEQQYMFQSTHPLGVRLNNVAKIIILAEFQSTHPLGVRHYQGFRKSYPVWFQSTHPLGVRHTILSRI